MRAIHHPSVAALSGALVAALLLGLTSMSPILQTPLGTHSRAVPTSHQCLTPEQLRILEHMSIVYLDDAQGGQVETIRISGVNLQIVNGLGATNGNPGDPYSFDATVANGAGNVIIGYNEPGVWEPQVRTGSHMLVCGTGSNYSSFGGIVCGWENTASGAMSSVVGGFRNVASGVLASTIGGDSNRSTGPLSTVTGGSFGVASGSNASVSGGKQGMANGDFSSVLGGQLCHAIGDYSAVLGGLFSVAQQDYEHVP